MIRVRLYRYHPEQDAQPRMEGLEIDERFRRMMVLDVLEYLKERDTTLTYRRSCREGVCGSDGMNINGKNGLARHRQYQGHATVTQHLMGWRSESGQLTRSP